MFRFSKLFVAYQLILSAPAASEALPLLPAFVLFGRVTSSLKFESRFLRSNNHGGLFSCVSKFEHVVLVRSCDVLKQPTLGAYPAPLIFKVGSTREFFLIL